MPSSSGESFNWRTANAVAAIGVLGLFLYSVHSILSPILLFLLVLLVLAPYAGTHNYVVAVTAAASLTALWILHTTGFLLAPFLLALALACYLFLPPILTFYLLRDWKVLLARVGDLVPPARRGGVFGFAHEYDGLLSRYLRGQLTEAVIVGVLTWLGYQVLGIPFAILL